MRVRVKVCGITNLDDALFAADCGVDALGFIFYRKSPRYIEPSAAGEIAAKLPPFVSTVGVFVNEPADDIKKTISEAGLDTVQLHGDERPEDCKGLGENVIKAFRIRGMGDLDAFGGYEVSAFLLDAYKAGVPGGTGQVFDWEVAVAARRHGNIILSGGLNTDNVAEAIRIVRPYAVDVSSGVESSPGRKDHEKIRRFMSEVYRANKSIPGGNTR